jgi:hypothetical protein
VSTIEDLWNIMWFLPGSWRSRCDATSAHWEDMSPQKRPPVYVFTPRMRKFYRNGLGGDIVPIVGPTGPLWKWIEGIGGAQRGIFVCYKHLN